MIVGGQTKARAQLSSTIIDYHEPFDQGFTSNTVTVCDNDDDENFDKSNDCGKDVDNDSHKLYPDVSQERLFEILKRRAVSKGKLLKGKYEAKGAITECRATSDPPVLHVSKTFEEGSIMQ